MMCWPLTDPTDMCNHAAPPLCGCTEGSHKALRLLSASRCLRKLAVTKFPRVRVGFNDCMLSAQLLLPRVINSARPLSG